MESKCDCEIDQALHKILTFDIIRQNRIPALLCSNNAKLCYDCIIHSIASIAYCHLGIAQPQVSCTLKNIQNIHFHFQASYGLSLITLSNRNTLIPFQGVLQGNGAATTTWVIISTLLLNMLQSARNGGHFQSLVSKERTHLVAFAFVDNTDLLSLNMIDLNITFDDVATQMQESIDRWEGGLKTTGGAIIPHKSWIYAMDFEFDSHRKPHFKLIHDLDYQFNVLDENNICQPLEKIEYNKGKETLRVFLDPEVNHEEAASQLYKKSKEWRDNIKAGHLSRDNAWLAIQSTIMKTLEYPLPALMLSKQQCTKIMTPVLEGSLAKSQLIEEYQMH